MKRYLTLAITAALMLSAFSCGSGGEGKDSSTSAPDSTGKIENSAAAPCSCKIKSGKFTKTVDFRCEMCYTMFSQ